MFPLKTISYLYCGSLRQVATLCRYLWTKYKSPSVPLIQLPYFERYGEKEEEEQYGEDEAEKSF